MRWSQIVKSQQNRVELATRPGRLFQTLVPLFMPEDGNPYKLVGHHHGLVDQVGGVFPNLVEDLVGGAAARSCASLASHGERVDRGLRGVARSCH